MLQGYVPNVLAVSFLCCSKYFHVASVLSRCCICFSNMLQVYVPNVSFASDLCCIQVFHVASVSCFRGMFRESRGTTWAQGEGARRAEGRQIGAHGASRVLRTERARPHPDSRVPPARREEGVRGKEWWAQPGCACGASEADGSGARQTGDGHAPAAAIRSSGKHGRAGWAAACAGIRTHSSAPDVRALVSPFFGSLRG